MEVETQMFFIGDDDDDVPPKEVMPSKDQERAEKWREIEKDMEKIGIRPRRGRKWRRRNEKVDMLRGLD